MNFLIWAAGSLVFPLLPLALAYIALRMARQPRTTVALFGDGGILFYATSLVAAVWFDVWRDRVSAHPSLDADTATAATLVAGLVTTLTSGLFAFMTLARTQPASSFDLGELARAPWQSALAAAIVCALFRWLTGLY